MAETARYLNAITRDVSADQLASTTGVDGGRLETVEHRGLVAVVSDVSLAEYDDAGLRRNLERLDWLEKVARSHNDVIQTVASLGPVAPLRLATICLDDSGVRARLEEWHDGLHEALDRVEGCDEWSVKVLGAPATTHEKPGVGGSGADYLKRKKAAVQSRASAHEEQAAAAESIHAALADGVVANRILPPQDSQLSGYSEPMILNGAYLVPQADATRFEDAVTAMIRENPGVAIHYGGPWPPYSFATLDQS